MRKEGRGWWSLLLNSAFFSFIHTGFHRQPKSVLWFPRVVLVSHRIQDFLQPGACPTAYRSSRNSRVLTPSSKQYVIYTMTASPEARGAASPGPEHPATESSPLLGSPSSEPAKPSLLTRIPIVSRIPLPLPALRGAPEADPAGAASSACCPSRRRRLADLQRLPPIDGTSQHGNHLAWLAPVPDPEARWRPAPTRRVCDIAAIKVRCARAATEGEGVYGVHPVLLRLSDPVPAA